MCRCYYPHRLSDSVSAVCRIFLVSRVTITNVICHEFGVTFADICLHSYKESNRQNHGWHIRLSGKHNWILQVEGASFQIPRKEKFVASGYLGPVNGTNQSQLDLKCSPSILSRQVIAITALLSLVLYDTCCALYTSVLLSPVLYDTWFALSTIVLLSTLHYSITILDLMQYSCLDKIKLSNDQIGFCASFLLCGEMAGLIYCPRIPLLTLICLWYNIGITTDIFCALGLPSLGLYF